MKKIILIATALLMGFFADAANLFFWDWPAMPAISSSTTNVFCLPASANVRVGFYYDYNVVVGTSRQYRAMVELRNPSTGATFNSPWAPVTSAAAGSYAATYTSPTQTTSVNVSASGRYSATVWVQYRESIGGTWSSWYSFNDFKSTATGPDFQFNQKNDNVTFTVNGKKQTLNGTPPEIVLCNGAELKIDNITGLGTHTTIETSMESGWYEPLAPVELRFTPYSGYISPYLVCYPGTISLTGLLSPYRSYFYVVPAGGVRYVKVKVKVYGPCDPAPGYKEVEMVFKVTDANALVHFMMQGPLDVYGNGCLTDQPRNETGVFASFAQPVSAPPCYDGWLGATSCNVRNGFMDATGAGYLGYEYLLERVSPSPAILGTASGPGVLPAGQNLNSLCAGYFITNYNTIKNNETYKITATVKTSECGDVKAHSYFKIIDGAVDGQWWRTTSNVIEQTIEKVNVFPNPATNEISLFWNATSIQSNNASLMLTNVLGQAVLEKGILENSGSNEHKVDISGIGTGVYFYTLKTSAGDFTGRLVKQ